MAIPIATTEPTEFRENVTYKWKKSLSDYPATTWELNYRFQGETSATAAWGTEVTADGSDYQIVLSQTFTDALTVGEYWLGAYVDNAGGTERADILKMRVTVVASFDVATPVPLDYRTDARIIYEALIASMKDRATRPEKQYSLQAAGRSFTFHTHMELQEAIQYWGSVVRAEEKDELVKQGKSPGDRILVRF